jgi:hypothetical protein
MEHPNPTSQKHTHTHTRLTVTQFATCCDFLNLWLPRVRVQELVKSFSVKTNDQMLIVYLSSLVRAIVSLHTLISNKIQNREDEKKKIAGDKEKGICAWDMHVVDVVEEETEVEERVIATHHHRPVSLILPPVELSPTLTPYCI